MKNIKEQFHSLILERRLSNRSLTESFHQAQNLLDLNPQDVNCSPALQLLYQVSEQLLEIQEKDGCEKAALEMEPAYHNRQHFADAVLALSFLLSQLNIFTDENKQLLLLTMLVHDFGHRGIGAHSQSNMTHEEESVELLKKTAISQLTKSNQEKVFQLIIGTTIKDLNKINERHRLEPHNRDHLMQALINDADIICSFIPELGKTLTKDILIESGIPEPSDSQIREAYLEFEKRFSLTTDIAKLIC